MFGLHARNLDDVTEASLLISWSDNKDGDSRRLHATLPSGFGLSNVLEAFLLGCLSMHE